MVRGQFSWTLIKRQGKSTDCEPTVLSQSKGLGKMALGILKCFHDRPSQPIDVVTYNNLECSCYDYVPCFNVTVTALVVLPPFYFRMFEIISFQFVQRSSTVIELLGCLPFLISIFRLGVCNVVIMLQFVIVSSYTFSIVMYQGFFWDI